MTEKTGTLYLCPTPIGNLEDMTYRAVRILKEVSLIAAEDTRHTRKLLSHFDIHTPLISYHEHNKKQQGPLLVERLLQGESIAVVSDAGMPGISDPGSDLVRLALAADIPVIPLPGANAALTGLIASGLDTTCFSFIGFLPKTGKKRKELLAQLKGQPYTLIFYESPHRLKEMLKELQDAFGDRQGVAARELTKKFEEFLRMPLSKLREHFAAVDPRGEFCLLVEGAGEAAQPEAADIVRSSLEEAVAALMAAGTDKKEAMKQVAVERGVSKREVYQALLAWEQKK